MTQQERIAALQYLSAVLAKNEDKQKAVLQKTYYHNRWFTVENSTKALAHIREAYLDTSKLESWLAKYPLRENKPPRNIGIIMSANTPLDGFHDFLCVFLSGNNAKIKLSEQNKFLLPYFVAVMQEADERVAEQVEFVERLKGFDAVIASGENKDSRYLKAYFGKYPHLIREHLNAVAVLTGKESEADLKALAENIFRYFGLGTRNVSKLYLPGNYNFEPLLEALHEHKEVVLHDKYKNNFDYNYTLIILNNIPYFANGCMLLTENTVIPSRIAQLHFEYYENRKELVTKLAEKKAEIEVVVAAEQAGDLKTVAFDESYKPGLADYPGNEDTMGFLQGLDEV